MGTIGNTGRFDDVRQVALASNITVARRKTVTIDGYSRDGLDYLLAEIMRRIDRGLPLKGESGSAIGDSKAASLVGS